MKKKKYNDNTIEELKEIFPENENFERMLQRLKNLHSSESNNNSKSTLNNTISKTQKFSRTTINMKKKRSISQEDVKSSNKNQNSFLVSTKNNKTNQLLYLTQQRPENADIETKVIKYRKKLNMELMKVLNEERKKEQEREIKIAKIENEKERIQMDKLFGIERANASQRIISLNR